MQNKRKFESNGITLVALIVTIIILLILAGVSIVTLTESGLFYRARQAEQKTENAQIKEETTLGDYENKIGEYVDSTRNPNTMKMHSPIKLVNAELPHTALQIRSAGSYKASSSSYTKTNTDASSKYLSFEEGKGWTVLKDGWYYFSAVQQQASTANSPAQSRILLNGESLGSFMYTNNGSENPSANAYAGGTSTLYLNKGDLIEFEFNVAGSGGSSSYANFIIYAMFE